MVIFEDRAAIISSMLMKRIKGLHES
jgi:hypothetical protein